MVFERLAHGGRNPFSSSYQPPNACSMVMYSERLAHLIYAAADMVLVPSMFEPCGLTQLIAMRCVALVVLGAGVGVL